MGFEDQGLVGFQVLSLEFLLFRVELGHLCLKGLGLAVIAIKVF